MPLPASKVNKALVNKIGFERQDRRHRVYLLKVGNRAVAQTLMSHGAKELDNKLFAMMARQIGLKRSELEDIVSCALERDGYLALLGIKQ